MTLSALYTQTYALNRRTRRARIMSDNTLIGRFDSDQFFEVETAEKVDFWSLSCP